jgi:hypothetical protein
VHDANRDTGRISEIGYKTAKPVNVAVNNIIRPILIHNALKVLSIDPRS